MHLFPKKTHIYNSYPPFLDEFKIQSFLDLILLCLATVGEGGERGGEGAKAGEARGGRGRLQVPRGRALSPTGGYIQSVSLSFGIPFDL